MAQGEERRRVGQHGAPPGRVALVSDDQVLLVGGDGLEKNRRLVVLIRGREVVLKEEGNMCVMDHICPPPPPRERAQRYVASTA